MMSLSLTAGLAERKAAAAADDLSDHKVSACELDPSSRRLVYALSISNRSHQYLRLLDKEAERIRKIRDRVDELHTGIFASDQYMRDEAVGISEIVRILIVRIMETLYTQMDILRSHPEGRYLLGNIRIHFAHLEKDAQFKFYFDRLYSQPSSEEASLR
jgi:hypothetical protein